MKLLPPQLLDGALQKPVEVTPLRIGKLFKRTVFRCRQVFDQGAADAAAAKNKRDQSLSRYAEKVVQILIDMDTPGSRFLDLTEE